MQQGVYGKTIWNQYDYLSLKKKSSVTNEMGTFQAIWRHFCTLNFLKSPKASLVEGIFRHNADDIKTLLSLYSHLSRIIHHQGILPTENEAYEIARWFASIGEHEQALLKLQSYLQGEINTNNLKLHRLMATCHKKLGDNANAYSILRKLADYGLETDICSFIECAKLCEHVFKDYKLAHFYTEMAINLFEKKTFIIREKYHKDKMDIQKRLERLQDKLKNARHEEGK